MSTTIGIDEAQATLKELIHRLAPGEEIVIIEDHQPVAKLVCQPSAPASGLRPPPGLGKGLITVIVDDEEHLKDFEDYMP
jgi:antitoxin (DNA-binding transcriptional repressor) of toxin-antitoxin stability system